MKVRPPQVVQCVAMHLPKRSRCFNQRDIDAFNVAVSLFTNKSTYFALLPRDVTDIIKEYISYVPATLR